jgi:hypothetical protein
MGVKQTQGDLLHIFRLLTGTVASKDENCMHQYTPARLNLHLPQLSRNVVLNNAKVARFYSIYNIQQLSAYLTGNIWRPKSEPSKEAKNWKGGVWFPRHTRPANIAAWFVLVSCFAYSSTLNMEATGSYETSGDFRRTTWLYVPQNRTLSVTCLAHSESLSRNFILLYLIVGNAWGRYKPTSQFSWVLNILFPTSLVDKKIRSKTAKQFKLWRKELNICLKVPIFFKYPVTLWRRGACVWVYALFKL